MKKYGLRVLFGVIAFGIGTFGVWFLVSEIRFRNYCNADFKTASDVENEQRAKNLTGKVEIRFKQTIQTKDGNAFQFDIENNTNETIKYGSYGSYELKENNLVMFPLYEVQINGNKTNQMWCGIGLMNYYLKSGESKVFQIYISGVVLPWKKGQKLQVGFNFAKDSNPEYQTVWSENLVDSNEMEKLLMNEKKEVEKRIKS